MDSLSRNERIAAAFYFIWFFLHLGFFFYSDETIDSVKFWPFIHKGQTLAGTYDISEFVIYVGIPLILFIAYKIIYTTQEYSGNHKHASYSFLIAFLQEKIKAEELTQKLNELTGKQAQYDYLNELKSDLEKACSQTVSGWLDRFEVKKKYKEFAD